MEGDVLKRGGFKHESQYILPFFLVSGVTYRDFSFRGQASWESPRIEVS